MHVLDSIDADHTRQSGGEHFDNDIKSPHLGHLQRHHCFLLRHDGVCMGGEGGGDQSPGQHKAMPSSLIHHLTRRTNSHRCVLTNHLNPP